MQPIPKNIIIRSKLNPESIFYAGSDGQIRIVSISEFSRLKNFEWTENILADPTVLPPLLDCIGYFPDIVTPIENLYVKEISPDCGAGVFARVPLKKGTYLGFYTGIVELSRGDKDQSYYMQTNYMQTKLQRDYDYKHVINACNFGNITRFIQDLPEQEELDRYYHFTTKSSEPGMSKTQIAIANVQSSAQLIEISKFPPQSLQVVIFETTRDIQANEMLGFSYSFIGAWSKIPSKRLFFNTIGEILPRNTYFQKHVISSVSRIKGTGEEDSQTMMVTAELSDVVNILRTKQVPENTPYFDQGELWTRDFYYPFLRGAMLYFFQIGIFSKLNLDSIQRGSIKKIVSEITDTTTGIEFLDDNIANPVLIVLLEFIISKEPICFSKVAPRLFTLVHVFQAIFEKLGDFYRRERHYCLKSPNYLQADRCYGEAECYAIMLKDREKSLALNLKRRQLHQEQKNTSCAIS
jgi:hypothetical protein